jgi:hypothetical protein
MEGTLGLKEQQSNNDMARRAKNDSYKDVRSAESSRDGNEKSQKR